jgi:RimJ/RimL family protein N-acetyltransferase
MSTTIITRRATIHDINKIRLLELELIAFEQQIVPSLKQSGEIHYYDLAKIIADEENSLLLLLEVNGQLAGCGLGQIRINKDYYQEKYFGYIGLMSLKPSFRGKGYGPRIINELLDWFRTREIKEVKLKVFSNNDSAIASYKKVGFAELMTEMRLDM